MTTAAEGRVGGARPLRLVTLSPSHYCEKARWALERAGVPYVEERHAPLLHPLATVRLARTRQVPILVTPSEVIADSTAILKHLDAALDGPQRLFPDDSEGAIAREASELEELYDRKLGPATRGWAYSWVLNDPALFLDLLDVELPRWEHVAFRAIAPGVRQLMKRAFPTDLATRGRRLASVTKLFAEVSERLADGRAFLTGDRFTAADLTFGCLAAPAVLPPEYGTPMPDIARVPAEIRRDIETLRATPAGQFIARLFREERRRSA